MRLTQAGFSLAEAAMAGALVAGLGLAGMQMAQMVTGQQGKDNALVEAKQFTALFRDRLGYAESCRRTLGGKSALGASAFDIVDDAGNVVFAANSKYESIIYEGLEIRPPVPNDTSFVIPGGRGMIFVTAAFRRAQDPPGENVIRRKFKIAVVADAANMITNCAAIQTLAEIWERSPLNQDNIMYNAGDVGIGMNPTVALDVRRNVAVRASSGERVVMGGNLGTDVRLTVQSDLPLVFRNLATGGNAAMALKDLRTSGEVQAGSFPTCDPALMGALRFEPAISNLQYCNGTLWLRTDNE